MQNRTTRAQASQPSTAVNFDVPAGACDCHTHIHADPERFPLYRGRVYTPELASPEEMSALHRALGIERVVIVTPSIYGTDNSATLFGMRPPPPQHRSRAATAKPNTSVVITAPPLTGERPGRSSHVPGEDLA